MHTFNSIPHATFFPVAMLNLVTVLHNVRCVTDLLDMSSAADLSQT